LAVELSEEFRDFQNMAGRDAVSGAGFGNRWQLESATGKGGQVPAEALEGFDVAPVDEDRSGNQCHNEKKTCRRAQGVARGFKR
jgi:hypothetical protein